MAPAPAQQEVGQKAHEPGPLGKVRQLALRTTNRDPSAVRTSSNTPSLRLALAIAERNVSTVVTSICPTRLMTMPSFKPAISAGPCGLTADTTTPFASLTPMGAATSRVSSDTSTPSEENSDFVADWSAFSESVDLG